jgi:hypothetical protein
MRALLLGGFVCFVIVVGIIAFDHKRAADERRMLENESTQDFGKNSEHYNALEKEWGQLTGYSPSCVEGQLRSQFLYQWLDVMQDGYYDASATGHPFLHTKDLSQIARLFNTSREGLLGYVVKLHAAGKNAIGRSGVEFRIYYQAHGSRGLMHVNPACREYSTLVHQSRNGVMRPITILKELGSGWFYFVEKD